MTIRDVAARAGVSRATVSRVFTQPESVTPETRRRVLDAADALRYTPHPVARSLARGRTGNLGMVVPDIAIAFCAVITKAVSHRARRDGYALFVADSDEPVGATGEPSASARRTPWPSRSTASCCSRRRCATTACATSPTLVPLVRHQPRLVGGTARADAQHGRSRWQPSSTCTPSATAASPTSQGPRQLLQRDPVRGFTAGLRAARRPRASCWARSKRRSPAASVRPTWCWPTDATGGARLQRRRRGRRGRPAGRPGRAACPTGSASSGSTTPRSPR